jgi:hypothetical protein
MPLGVTLDVFDDDDGDDGLRIILVYSFYFIQQRFQLLRYD